MDSQKRKRMKKKISQIIPVSGWQFYYFNDPNASSRLDARPTCAKVIAWCVVTDDTGDKPDAIVVEGGILSIAGDFNWPDAFVYESNKKAKSENKPLDVQSILKRFEGVVCTGKNQWRAKCPAHKDASTSLAIAFNNGNLIFNCMGNDCSILEICQSIGISLSDIISEENQNLNGESK